MEFLSIILNGLAIGALYGLFATGYALTFSVLGVINFAHGAVVTIAPYCVLLLLERHFSFPSAALMAVIACALLSMLLYLVFFENLTRYKSGPMPLVASLGLASLLSHLTLILFGGETRNFPPELTTGFPDSVAILGVNLRFFQLVILAVSILIFSALGLFLRFSLLGRALFAVAENEEMASLVGLNPRLIKASVFALAGFLAGVCGILFGLSFGISGPYFGLSFGLKGLAVLVMGGLGSMRGALLAGALLGCIEAAVPGELSGFKDAFAIGILFLCLIVLPRGLFGQAIADRV